MLITLLVTGVIISCVSKKKLETTQAQANELRDANAKMQRQAARLNANINELSARNESLQNELSTYKTSCMSTQQKLEAVQGMLAEEEDILQRVQDKLETAMADFSKRGVDVYFKNGLLYVSLPDELLYKTGSFQLDSDGKKALTILANILNDYPKLKVIVVGNTDNVKYKAGSDNWTLSTERANGVVRLLSQEYKVDAARLTSAGKGKYNPVADNTTLEGRARNRRTDIILNPDYDRILESARRE
jgi:chemotaxis protein MotB